MVCATGGSCFGSNWRRLGCPRGCSVPPAVIATPNTLMLAEGDLSRWSESTCHGLGEQCSREATPSGSFVQHNFSLLLIGTAGTDVRCEWLCDRSICWRVRNDSMNVHWRYGMSACNAYLVVAESFRDRHVPALPLVMGMERHGVNSVAVRKLRWGVERAVCHQPR